MVNTMLSEDSFKVIIGSLPKNLTALNLSQNEHLTVSCYKELHSVPKLTHLSLEKCNITDDILKVILDLKPHNKDTDDDTDGRKKPGL